MPIPTTIADLSTVASSNSPSGSDPPSEGDNYLRALSAIIKQEHESFADTASTSAGDALIGVKLDATGAAARTQHFKNADIVSVKDFGAVGDGVSDDTAAIQAAISAAVAVDMRDGTYKITSTINIPAGRFIDMRAAFIAASCGATPIFKFGSGNSGLYILGGGGFINGTASSFLQCEGTTDQPTNVAHYARQIRLEGIYVSSSTITQFLDLQLAARQIFIDKCFAFTPSGINASGKCVEVMISNSIIYSATGSAGTFGIKLRSTGGTSYYNEGWSVNNCTVDAFDVTFDITDIYVFQVANCYVSSQSSGYAFQFQAPSTTHCEEINIGHGCVFSNKIRFASSGSGRSYYARIEGFVMSAVPGTAIAIENNASHITVSNGKFKGASGTAIGVVGSNNNYNINCTNLDFDSTYTNGVVLNGASGTDCVIGPVSGPTSGAIIGAGSRAILFNNIPVHSTSVAALTRVASSSNLGAGATYAVGVTIGSLSGAWVRGEKGRIIIHLPYSGANALTQNVQISPPSGMVFDSGTGFSAANFHLGAASGLLSVAAEYYCNADTSGTVSVINQAGNTLTVNNQAYIAISKNC